MKNIFTVLAVGSVLGFAACALTGCGSSSSTADKMSGGATGMEDKMMNNKMTGDKMTGDKMQSDKMSTDKMSTDKMSTDKMSTDKMNADKMNADKMGVGADKMGH